MSSAAGNQRAAGDEVDREDRNEPQERRIREARLKPEFAHLYPPLEPGQWEPAALMADRVVAWLLRQPDRGYMAPDRVLRSEHFEFRGGTDTARSRTESYTRRNNSV